MLRNNDGVHKLTSFAKYEDGGVSRVKQAMLRTGRHLIMYEVWLADRFERYEFIVVDDDAKIMKGPWSPKVPARMFGFRDEVMMIDGKAVFYDAVGGELRRYTVTWLANSNARTWEKAKEISKSRIPDFPLNLSGLVLGCIEAKFCE